MGTKIQSGGLKLGLIKLAYQSFAVLWAAKPDRNPISRQMLMAMVMCVSFFFKMASISTKIAI